MNLDSSARAELRELAQEGTLTPERVLERARSSNSSLYRHFEWDDTVAAAKFRVQQARSVIRVVVQVDRRPRAAQQITIRRAESASIPASAPVKITSSAQSVLPFQPDLGSSKASLEALRREILALGERYPGLSSKTAVFHDLDKVIKNRIEFDEITAQAKLADQLAKTRAIAVQPAPAANHLIGPVPQRHDTPLIALSEIPPLLTELDRRLFRYLPADGTLKRVTGPQMSQLIRTLWARFAGHSLIEVSGDADHEVARLRPDGKQVRGMIETALAAKQAAD